MKIIILILISISLFATDFKKSEDIEYKELQERIENLNDRYKTDNKNIIYAINKIKCYEVLKTFYENEKGMEIARACNELVGKKNKTF